MGFSEKVNSLPEEVRNFFRSNDVRLAKTKAFFLYNLTEKELYDFSAIGDIFVGEMELAELPMKLMQQFNLGAKIAYGVAHELNQTIFLKFPEYFKDAQALDSDWARLKYPPSIDEEKAMRRIYELEPWLLNEKREEENDSEVDRAEAESAKDSTLTRSGVQVESTEKKENFADLKKPQQEEAIFAGVKSAIGSESFAQKVGLPVIEAEFEIPKPKAAPTKVDLSQAVAETFFANKKSQGVFKQDPADVVKKESAQFEAEKERVASVKIEEEAEKIETEKLNIHDALAKYSKLRDQHVGVNAISLKNSPGRVSPSIGNWLLDYQDTLGKGRHGTFERASYLFKNDNAKKLTPIERERLTLILRSFDDDDVLDIDVKEGKVVFPSNSKLAEKVFSKKPQSIPQKPLPKPVQFDAKASLEANAKGGGVVAKDIVRDAFKEPATVLPPSETPREVPRAMQAPVDQALANAAEKTEQADVQEKYFAPEKTDSKTEKDEGTDELEFKLPDPKMARRKAAPVAVAGIISSDSPNVWRPKFYKQEEKTSVEEFDPAKYMDVSKVGPLNLGEEKNEKAKEEAQKPSDKNPAAKEQPTTEQKKDDVQHVNEGDAKGKLKFSFRHKFSTEGAHNKKADKPGKANETEKAPIQEKAAPVSNADSVNPKHLDTKKREFSKLKLKFSSNVVDLKSADNKKPIKQQSQNIEDQKAKPIEVKREEQKSSNIEKEQKDEQSTTTSQGAVHKFGKLPFRITPSGYRYLDEK